MILKFPLQSQSCFAFLFFVALLIKPFVNLLLMDQHTKVELAPFDLGQVETYEVPIENALSSQKNTCGSQICYHYTNAGYFFV